MCKNEAKLFELTNGRVVSGWDIKKAHEIIYGGSLDTENDEEFNHFVECCCGIYCEYTEAGVTDLLFRGEYVKAIKLYKDTHNSSLVEAKAAVDKIRDEMRERKEINW